MLNTEGTKPIYVQIAEWLEAEIISGQIGRDEKMYSQYQLAEMFNINPATAAKGLKLLLDEEILYKKRGLGMFVSASAQSRIVSKRKNETLKQLALEFVVEAKRLQLDEDEMLAIIRTLAKEEF